MHQEINRFRHQQG